MGRIRHKALCMNCMERSATRTAYLAWVGTVGVSYRELRLCGHCLSAWIDMHVGMGEIRTAAWEQLPLMLQAAVPPPPRG